ncbi:MAG TPA: type II toxin-antitoxin system VapC family toxin [Polyangiaceae bacterium]
MEGAEGQRRDQAASRGQPLIVLDTHTLVWWLGEPDRLSVRARNALDGEDGLIVPSIVFWEVALLVRDRRVELGYAMPEWVRLVRSLSRVEVAPLTPEIAVDSVDLDMHPDPADRFIVATALARGVPLVTKDRKIRAVEGLETVW